MEPDTPIYIGVGEVSREHSERERGGGGGSERGRERERDREWERFPRRMEREIERGR